ncbi:hypothetical protein OS125_11500 [Corynebacterium sp. P7003]|uniref:RecT-like ssDNA binding protein n=1 Tax=Corynebacterium pygosceleis TaxID=2800406 RepID=A0ABT3WUH9_9CORY|nr:hypothetical protein [Corynebacterium pygosceleis]MCX7445856.1 hypothetical protein [Corynebacterium pygosceleis]
MSNLPDTYDSTGPNLPEITDDGLGLLQRQVEAMDAAHRLASVLCTTAMVPATFRGKPDDGAAAILYGAELGLKPQQALQQVFVVHGMPAVYARTMVALLKSRGYRIQTVESSDTSVTVRGESPRGEVEESTWSIERAKQAGYTSNKKYASDPQAMLYAKAASEVCRKLAPDVLLGIAYSKEELELEPVKMTATRTDRPSSADSLKQQLKQEQAPELDTPKVGESPLEAFTNAATQAKTRDELTTVAFTAKDQLSDDEYKRLSDEVFTPRWNELPDD